MVIPDTSSEATVSREAASYGTMRAPRPCLPSNWASMADAASSSGPLPARQRTGASVRHVGANSSRSRSSQSGGGVFDISRSSLGAFSRVENPATRVAALLSGDLDMIYNVPPQDIEHVEKNPAIKVWQTPELRTMFLGMDQSRDELLESNVKGKNPFKDKRVRQAFYQAIDEDAIASKVMRGFAHRTALMVGPGVNGYDPTLEKRYPYDPAAAKKLLAEAGYPDGFQVGFDCPNDRYVNDEAICQAVVAMLAKIGVKA
jgi:hypothetical protein